MSELETEWRGLQGAVLRERQERISVHTVVRPLLIYFGSQQQKKSSATVSCQRLGFLYPLGRMVVRSIWHSVIC